MQHTQHDNMHDTKIGLVTGFIGGFAKYISTIHLHEDFAAQVIEAAITALICGAAGVLGKEIISFIKRKIK